MNEKLYMTKTGFNKLKEELRRLKGEERPKIIQAIREAREHGDLSENAEYHAAKEKQEFIENRISTIEEKLSRAKIIDPADLAQDKIVFGTTVILLDEEERKLRYTLVGAEETDVEKGKISVTSPIARGLLGHRKGDQVTIKIPAGVKEYEIQEIFFEE